MSEPYIILRTISALLEGITFKIYGGEFPDSLLDFGECVEYLRNKCSSPSRIESLAIVLDYRNRMSHVDALPSILELNNAVTVLKKWFISLNPKNNIHQQVENMIVLSVELLEILLDRELNTCISPLISKKSIYITNQSSDNNIKSIEQPKYIKDNIDKNNNSKNIEQPKYLKDNIDKNVEVTESLKDINPKNVEQPEYLKDNREKDNNSKFEEAPKTLQKLKETVWIKQLRKRKMLVTSGKYINCKVQFIEWGNNIANCVYTDPFTKHSSNMTLPMNTNILIYKLNYKDLSITKINKTIYEYEDAPETFRELRDTQWKEQLKQRKILVLSGKHINNVLKFVGWSGTVAFCMYKDKAKGEYTKIGLSIDTIIKILK